MKIVWNWKQQHMQVGSLFLLVTWYASLGVVLGRWGGGGPWFGGMAGCPWWGFWYLVFGSWFFRYSYVAVWRAQGVPPPFKMSMSFLVFMHLALVFWPRVSQAQNKLKLNSKLERNQ
jgi:hypothetical protein